mmetsp:Transcript_11343/g.32077  ORF Transcript_11343/g.32077 Transcript_11343/m.32077 type:complete len:229 (-) Transcript_11343:79-765(-)
MMSRRPNGAESIPVTTHKDSINCVLDSARCTTSGLERPGAEGRIGVFAFLDLSLSNYLLLDHRSERDDVMFVIVLFDVVSSSSIGIVTVGIPRLAIPNNLFLAPTLKLLAEIVHKLQVFRAMDTAQQLQRSPIEVRRHADFIRLERRCLAALRGDSIHDRGNSVGCLPISTRLGHMAEAIGVVQDEGPGLRRILQEICAGLAPLPDRFCPKGIVAIESLRSNVNRALE